MFKWLIEQITKQNKVNGEKEKSEELLRRFMGEEDEKPKRSNEDSKRNLKDENRLRKRKGGS